jgi:DNA-binding NarL/FixJ family response regulator
MKDNRRVLIVDDHPMMLRGLRSMLEGEPWVGEIVEAATAAEAVKEGVTRRADVVLMDVRLPDGDGLEATRSIARALPQARILVVTMVSDEDVVSRALAAGAHGVVLKDLDPVDLMSALRAVAGGNLVLGPRIGPALLEGARERGPGLPAPLDQLTPRELEILTLLGSAEPTSRIARRLGVSEKTVRNQLSLMFGKLRVRDRVEAALLAQRLGLRE